MLFFEYNFSSKFDPRIIHENIGIDCLRFSIGIGYNGQQPIFAVIFRDETPQFLFIMKKVKGIVKHALIFLMMFTMMMTIMDAEIEAMVS